jgi:hypothetical protein
MGKGFETRLEKELPDVIDEWKKRAETDRKWGIKPDSELINYALLTDYMRIIGKYKKIFAGNEDENVVITKLKDFANYGRNPLMHFRNLTEDNYTGTKLAVDFLREWIRRNTTP